MTGDRTAAAALDAEAAAGSNSPERAAAAAAAKQNDGVEGGTANTNGSGSTDVNGGSAVAGAGAQDANAEGTPAAAAEAGPAAGAQETEVVPGPLWERGGTGPGGVDWGRQRGAGGSGPVEAGAGGAGAGGAVSPSAHGGEWDVGDGTVALRHLQNLAVQLPYKSWQVRRDADISSVVGVWRDVRGEEGDWQAFRFLRLVVMVRSTSYSCVLFWCYLT